MREFITEGQCFDMDPPRWALYPDRTQIWKLHELRGMFALIAPVDRCCIPVEVTRASFERALEAGALRPCSMVPA